MRSSSAFSAKRRFLLSLPWLALSLGALVQARASRERARQGGSARHAELQDLQHLNEQARHLGPAEGVTLPLAAALARVIDLLRDAEARYGVRIAQLTVPGARSSLQDGLGDATEIAALAHPLEQVPQLRMLMLQMRGTYSHYQGLQDWFAALETQPLSFDRIQLEDNQVQFGARLYGS